MIFAARRVRNRRVGMLGEEGMIRMDGLHEE
jgi:hypothetical protein